MIFWKKHQKLKASRHHQLNTYMHEAANSEARTYSRRMGAALAMPLVSAATTSSRERSVPASTPYAMASTMTQKATDGMMLLLKLLGKSCPVALSKAALGITVSNAMTAMKVTVMMNMVFLQEHDERRRGNTPYARNR